MQNKTHESLLIFARIKIFLFFRVKKLYFFFTRFEKIQKNKIVFSNFRGLGYGDNPKYIAEYIIKNNLPYKLIWLVDSMKCKDKNDFPKSIKIVEFHSLKAMHELSTAQIWIDNVRKTHYPPKKEKQLYIQTWHGTFPTKKIEKDAKLDREYQTLAVKDSKMINCLLSGSRQKTETYKTNFYYEGLILNVGQPRDDIFFSSYKEKIYTKVKNYYNIPLKSKIIIYAPTFRNTKNVNCYNIDYRKVKESFEKKYSCLCFFLVRLHPNLTNSADEIVLPNFVTNASFYPDMQELLCACDYIITDYSSSLDYSLSGKPIFLYCFDFEEYKKHERDFYIPIEDLPFPFATTNEELLKNIASFDKEKYDEHIQLAYKKYGLYSKGTASEEVIKFIQNYFKKYL